MPLAITNAGKSSTINMLLGDLYLNTVSQKETSHLWEIVKSKDDFFHICIKETAKFKNTDACQEYHKGDDIAKFKDAIESLRVT